MVTATVPIIELIPTTKMVTVPVVQTQVVTDLKTVTVAVCLSERTSTPLGIKPCRPLSSPWQVPTDQVWSPH